MLPRIHHRLLLPQLAAAFLLGTAVSCTVTNHNTPAPDATPAETNTSIAQTPERISFQTMVPTPPPSPTAYSAQMENLLRNPGFETDFADWNREPDPPGADTKIDTGIAHSGSRSLRIEFDGSADVDYWHVGQEVAVEPNTTYQLKGYLRSSGIQAYQSVCLTVTDGRGWDYLGYTTADLYGTRDWTPVSTIAFTTLPDTRTLRVVPGRGGMGGRFPIRGTVWIDDVALDRLPAHLSPSTANLRVGDTQTFTAANGKSPYRWSSSDPRVAEVRSDGNEREVFVTALSAGDVEITAVDAEGKTARAAVRVLADSAIDVFADRILREVPETMFGSNVNYFDTAAGGRPAFGDVIRDPAFLADVAGLGLTSLRFPGGTFANYYDFSLGKGYVDWAGGTGRYNFTGITTINSFSSCATRESRTA